MKLEKEKLNYVFKISSNKKFDIYSDLKLTLSTLKIFNCG